MSGWREAKLVDVGCTFLSGFAFKSADYSKAGVPLIKIGNIQNRAVKIDLHGDYVSHHLLDEKLSKYLLTSNDVLIAMTGQGSVGRVGRLKLHGDQKALLNQRVGKFICDEININIDYLYYVLASEKYQDYLFNTGSGSGQPNLSPELILETKIPWIEYPEQKVIASVLSCLDDKIDLLHRQNATLEAMAETLFRQWFEAEAMEDWAEYSVSDFADHIKNNVVPAKFADNVFHHYSLPAFDDGKRPKIELGSAILSNKYQVVENTILVSKLNPIEPRIWPIGRQLNDNAICSTEFQVLKPRNEKLYGYLYFLLRSNDAADALTMAASGTSGSHQRVKPEDIFNIKTSLPSIDRAEQYSRSVMPGIDKIQSNLVQIRTLEKLRDTLLPKLMSGEVRVRL